VVAAGEGRGYWSKQFVAFTAASSPAMNGWAKVHCDVVKAPKHVAQGCEVANSGESIRSDRDSGGYGGRSGTVA
jgi:nitrous oxidase accessory protein NosD